MTRLTDTQLLILNAAAQREDGNALPLPGSLRGGAATKLVGALLSRGLAAEHVTDSTVEAEHRAEHLLAQRRGGTRHPAQDHLGRPGRDRS